MAEAQSQVARAYDQVVEWLEHFEVVDDPRQSGKVAYPLEVMLLQCPLAVLAGAASAQPTRRPTSRPSSRSRATSCAAPPENTPCASSAAWDDTGLASLISGAR